MDDSSKQRTNQKWWTYDVFLSFRGEDTRRNFTDHLYYALKRNSLISTFRDDFNLRRGEDISSELLSAIRNSRICVVIFSKNYADSKWCLEELAEIVSCRKILPQLLLPVFYDVDPADVRKQFNSFAEAFSKHEQEFADKSEKVDRWRAALKEAGSISGWDLRNFADGHEGRFIEELVRHIARKLNPTYLNVATYPVGIEARVIKLSSWMTVGPNDGTRIFGICGMGGSGKTTLSKALFNQYLNSFEGESFIANVRENSYSFKGLTHLQKQLLFDVLNTETEVNNVDVGINIIKERLCRKRILLILDDIDSMNQVSAIARKRDWFGLGSRIIITTRDRQLLEALKVDEVFMMEDNLLDEDESLELFSWHAFQEPNPPNEYLECSKDVVSYCRSLPLALEVLGPLLCGRSILEWKGTIEKLKSIPHRHINEKLKISYDALNDSIEKNIFLDVCCFFVGMEKDYVVKILEGCYSHGEIGLNVLMSRCLVKIDDEKCLKMHDLLRDMGRDIVKEGSPDEPGKHTRLWDQEKICQILRNNTVTENIQGLVLQLNEENEEKFNAKTFRNMRNLRLLKLQHVRFIGNFNHLISKELRWIELWGCSLKVIPSTWYLRNLVVLVIWASELEKAWDRKQCLENLKILDLSHSYKLKKLPDFSKVSNLEELKLTFCSSLSELHPSIGQLHKLRSIDLKWCESLRSLPSNICKLKSLQVLGIEYCLRIDRLPEELGEMKSLTTIKAEGSAIRQIPNSVVQLDKLEYLSLGQDEFFQLQCFSISSLLSCLLLRKNSNTLKFLPASVLGLRSLRTLCLGDCNLTDNDIPMNIGSLSSLEELILSSNDFRHFPANLASLSNLALLDFSECAVLETIPELPKNLKEFYASECPLLVKISDLSTLIKPLQRVDLSHCRKLSEVPGLMVGGVLNFMDSSNLSSIFKMNLVKNWMEADKGDIILPGDVVPECFNFICCGPLLSFQVPKVNHKILRMEICLAFASQAGIRGIPRTKLTNKSKGRSWYLNYHDWNRRRIINKEFTTCLMKIQDSPPPLLDVGDDVDVECIVKDGFPLEKFGVHLVYDNYEILKVDTAPV